MHGPRTPARNLIPKQRTSRWCSALFVAICALVMTTRSSAAAPPEQSPCDPSASPSHCLIAEPYITEQVTLRAAGDGLLFARAETAGEPQLRVLDAMTLATLGVLSTGDTPLLYAEGYLYTSPVTPSIPLPLVLGVRRPDRPTLLGSFALPAAGALDWAITPGVLYLLAPGGSAGENELHAFSLAEPAQPSPASVVPGLARTRIVAHGQLLYAAGATGLTILDGANPAAPQALSSTEWFTATPLADVDIAASASYIYIMGRTALGDAVCHMIDARVPHGPLLAGTCPFIPHKTLVSGAFAYVNPNQSAAEYLDYRIFSLADPAAPTLVGATAQRWLTAFAVADGLVVQVAAGRLLRLRQESNGALTTMAQTWSLDELGVDGDVRGSTGNMAIIDRGAVGDGGARVLRFVDISRRSAPRPVGNLESPWIGADNLVVQGTHLIALHRQRLTLFDVRNPAQPMQRGQFASPLGDPLEHLIVDGPDHAYLLSDHNTLIAVDLSTPMTPTQAALVDLPGRTEVAAVAQRTLYLFGNDTLLIVDIHQPGQPHLVRSLPVPTPKAASAWGAALYIVDNGALQVLDITDPLSPAPGVRIEPPAGMRYAPMRGNAAGLLALQARRVAGGPDVSPYVAIFDISTQGAPRLAAIVAGAYEDAFFTGERLILPGTQVVAIGPGSRDMATLPAILGEPLAITFTDPAAPGLAITYTIAADAPSLTSDAPLTATARCLVHEADPLRPLLAPLGEATRAGPYTLRIVDCATGAPLPFDQAITATLAFPGAPPAGSDWAQATIAADLGDHWAPLPDAQNEGGTLRAALPAPIMWGVRGPAPDFVLLPWVAR